MLKWYADTFKLTEAQMTSKALRQIWWLTVVSIMAIPFYMMLEMVDMPIILNGLVLILFIMSLICLFCLCFTKFVNRFWARDKYLDEWEKDRKHQSMAFAFQVLCYCFASVGLFGVISDIFGFAADVTLPSVNLYVFSVMVMGLLLFGIFVMHLYLLMTTKPFDVADDLAA